MTTGREDVSLQAVGGVVIPERRRPRIESRYPFRGTDPEPAGAILENAHDVVRRQPLPFRVACEPLAPSVVPVQARSGGQPWRSGAVLVYGVDVAALESVGVAQVGRV